MHRPSGHLHSAFKYTTDAQSSPIMLKWRLVLHSFYSERGAREAGELEVRPGNNSP